MKNLTKIFLFIVCFVAIERFCHKQTEGFCLHKIQSSYAFDAKWQPKIDLSKSEELALDTALSQPYTFLGSGGQCYAFLSQDKQTVLKVFKIHHMHPLPWLEKLKLPSFLDKYKKQLILWREGKVEHVFGSCKIAYEELREETGLLYLHVNKTKHLNKTLTLIDKLGIKHRIDLDTTEFALQKKATLALPALNDFMKLGQVDKAKECLDSLFKLIIVRCQKGVADRDPVIKRNFGYIHTHAVEIDIGSFWRNESMKKPYIYKRELHYQTLKLKKWIKKHHPELLTYTNDKIHEYIQ